METSLNEKDPGRPKAVTNADEQEVVVNHSSKEEGGYDEPTSEQQPAPEKPKEQSTEKSDVEKKESPVKVLDLRQTKF